MAIKFSQFNLRTDSTATMHLVGYDGNQNIHITVDNLLNNFINGTENTIAMFGTGGTVLADSILSQDAGATILTVGGQLNVDAAATFDTDITVTGNSTLNGNVTLGDATTDLITQNGTLYLNGPIKDTTNTLGADDQILVSDASGELIFTDLADIAIGSAEVVEIPVKNLQGSALTKGDPVYISGDVGASGKLEVKLADASNAAKMPALGLLKQDLGINEEGFAVVTGKLRNLITSPIDGQTPLANDVIYVKAGGTTGAALTLTKPTGSNLIQNMGKVGRVSTSNDGTFVVSSILRTNDIPNLTLGKIWVGSTGNTIESSSITFTEATGAVRLDEYGIGTHTGTVAKNLAVDADGNVIETSGDIIDGSGTLNYLSKWTPDGNTLGNSTIYDNGTNVAIGTPTPSERFTLRTAGDGLGNEGIFITNPFAGSTPIVSSKSPFLSLATSNSSGYTSTIFMGRNGTATDQESKIEWSNSNDALSIYVKGTGTYREHARFGNLSSGTPRTYFGGDVGIGVTGPEQKLHVAGDTKIQGVVIVNSANSSLYIGSSTTGQNSTSTGSRNVVIGPSAFTSNTSARYNTAVGHAAMQDTTTGNFNSVLGNKGLEKNIDGSYNVAVGNQSLNFNTNSSNNTAVGYRALYKVQSDSNTGIGQNALSSLESSTSSNDNTGIGQDALNKITSGQRNVGVGVAAGQKYGGGNNNLITANDSVFIGADSDAGGDNQTNQIVIGYNAIGLGSNTAVLGNNNITTTQLKGNVGIGTDNPAYLLDVNEDDNVLAFRVTGGGGGAPIASFVRDVGATGSQVNINAQSNFPQIQFTNTGNTFSIGGDTSGNFKISDSDSIGTNDRITIDNTGNVGIGATNPVAKLEIEGGDHLLQLNTTSSSGSPYMSFNQAGARRSFIQNSYDSYNGNVLKLASEYGGISFFTGTSGTETQKVIIQSNGYVGIGITNPSQTLHVNGPMQSTVYYMSGTSTYMADFFNYIDAQSSNGILVRSGTTYKPVVASAFTVSSDYRLKSNIEPLENATSRLKQLEVHRFNWNDRLDEPKVDGFIAHEVAPIIPEAVLGEKDAVHEDGTPKHQGIDQAKLVPLLTAALQEAITKIENLEFRIQTLENQ